MNSSSISINETLIEAINAKQLRPALVQLSANSHLHSLDEQMAIEAAMSALRSLDTDIEDEIQRLHALLSANGISVRKLAVAEPSRAIHVIQLVVDTCVLEDAVLQLEQAAYRSDLREDLKLWNRFCQFYDQYVFLSGSGLQFRVRLNWIGDTWQRRLSKRFKPSLNDLAAIDLPKALSFAYPIVKLARRLFHRPAHRTLMDLGPFLGTPDGLIVPLLDFSGLSAGQALIDLGCGDGRILLCAAEQYDCLAVGYETDDGLRQAAKQKANRAGLSGKVHLVASDARTADVSSADVVFIFLPVSAIQNLVPELLARMKPGAVLLAHEQEELKASVQSDERIALIHRAGVTVAHKWIASD